LKIFPASACNLDRGALFKFHEMHDHSIWSVKHGLKYEAEALLHSHRFSGKEH